MRKFEYTTRLLQTGNELNAQGVEVYVRSDEALPIILEELGANGWELVSVTAVYGSMLLAVLKREYLG